MEMDRRTFARLLASAAALGGVSALMGCQGREAKPEAEVPLPTAGGAARKPVSTARYTGPETWVRSVPGVGPYVSLTFDDGPHPVNTPRLLDLLAREGVLATFFLIGKNVEAYPAVAQRIVAEGHEVGNHTWSHPDLMLLSDERVAGEVEKCQTVIREVTGRTGTLFRPPYGSFSRTRGAWLKGTYGLTTVMWSVDPQDWRLPGASVVAQRMLGAVHQGAILLAHDIHAPTIEAMRTVVPGLKSRGYECLTTSGLLARGAMS